MNSLTDLDDALESLADGADGAASTETILGILCDKELPGFADGAVGVAQADARMASILRVMAAKPELVYSSGKRRAALQLVLERLDEVAPSIPKQYGIDAKTQADEVCRRLARVVPDALNALEGAVDSYRGLDSLEAFRHQLLRHVNSDIGKAAVRPFLRLGGEPVESLRTCLGDAINYVSADAGNARAAFETATQAITRALESQRASPAPSTRRIAGVLQQVLDDLASHFADSPFSKPAKLSLRGHLRRHPLHLPGLDLSIPLELRNDGAGVAIDVELELVEAVGVFAVDTPRRVGDVSPGVMRVEVNGQTTEPSLKHGEPAMCEFRLSWVNSDGSQDEAHVLTELSPQDWTVDWGELRTRNPYSLEAVTTESELIGRARMLDRMISTLNTATVGSVYIHGQKRVGKTSLARVALKMMEAESGAKVIYRDIGSINNAEPALAVDALTRRLLRQLEQRSALVGSVTDYEPDGSLSPLVEALEESAAVNAPIIIALDEFDRMPAPLFRRTAEGDAFFTGLRSISTIEGVGLILIGGERMKLIINGPGVELNKFAAFPVDYIDRATQWAEFEELVRKPTDGRLAFTDEACELVYRYTSGNPYYTKLLCGQILQAATERRDAYIDSREVEVSVGLLLGVIDSTSFSHYWEDYVLEQDDRRDEVTLNRRRCLLAIGLASSGSDRIPTSAIKATAASVGLGEALLEREVKEMVGRGILTESSGGVIPRVRMFHRWLAERGQDQIILTATELAAAQRAVAARERQRVSAAEADSLVAKWGDFKGRAITGERVLEYVQQFGGHREQRLVFQLLEAVRFIGTADERALLVEAYKTLQQSMQERHGTWNRSQIALCYAGPVGKSGLAMARSFASANGFLRDQRGIRHPDDLAAAVASGVTDVVLIDDFVGTGASLSEDLRALGPHVPSGVFVHIFALAGTSRGIDVVAATADELFGEAVSAQALVEIASEVGPFSVEADLFGDADSARAAEELVRRFGEKLEPRAPLGYGDCCSLVVFSKTVPNNVPAILWSASRGAFQFTPLFPRN